MDKKSMGVSRNVFTFHNFVDRVNNQTERNETPLTKNNGGNNEHFDF